MVAQTGQAMPQTRAPLCIHDNSDSSVLFFLPSQVHLTGWYKVMTDHKDNLTSSCNCGQSISRTLSDFISNGSQLLMLDGSQELGCSPAFMQRDSVRPTQCFVEPRFVRLKGWLLTCAVQLGLWL